MRMKIARLERVSGVRRSTIHHYVNLGLLPQPRVAGPKLHLFDDRHLVRLREIQRLRAQGWSLARIRDELARMVEADPAIDDDENDEGSDALRERILRHATRLFAERGYEAVRLLDVARAAGLSKATIYRYFTSKHALFVDCVEHMRFTLIPREAREAEAREPDPYVRGRLVAAGLLRNFAAYRTLTQLLGALAHGSDARLARKAKGQLHAMITNMQPFLEQLVEAKLIPEQNAELLAYMLWGALMGAGERLVLDDRYTFREVLDAVFAFTTRGMGAPMPA
jgi:AcrR family transcriptional regulator